MQDLRSERFHFVEMKDRMLRTPENQSKELQTLLVQRSVFQTAFGLTGALVRVQTIFSDLKLKYINLETRQGLLEAVIKEQENLFNGMSGEESQQLGEFEFSVRWQSLPC